MTAVEAQTRASSSSARMQRQRVGAGASVLLGNHHPEDSPSRRARRRSPAETLRVCSRSTTPGAISRLRELADRVPDASLVLRRARSSWRCRRRGRALTACLRPDRAAPSPARTLAAPAAVRPPRRLPRRRGAGSPRRPALPGTCRRWGCGGCGRALGRAHPAAAGSACGLRRRIGASLRSAFSAPPWSPRPRRRLLLARAARACPPIRPRGAGT